MPPQIKMKYLNIDSDVISCATEEVRLRTAKFGDRLQLLYIFAL